MGLEISSLVVWAESQDNRWKTHRMAAELVEVETDFAQPSLQQNMKRTKRHILRHAFPLITQRFE